MGLGEGHHGAEAARVSHDTPASSGRGVLNTYEERFGVQCKCVRMKGQCAKNVERGESGIQIVSATILSIS